MMATINLLYKHEYAINDKIKILIPTIGEIIDKEDEYYSLVSLLTAMPIDLMAQLDDIGIDFTQINEYELFLILFEGIKSQDASLIFGDLDLSKFERAINEQNETIVYVDKENDIVIDRAIHGRIAAVLRKIHHLERNYRKPANDEVKKYLLERERVKLKRRKNKNTQSQLEPLIIAMVNAAEYKYDFEGTRNLTVYQFNESVRQVIHKVDYNNRMIGVYTGNINAKELSQDDLNWLNTK